MSDADRGEIEGREEKVAPPPSSLTPEVLFFAEEVSELLDLCMEEMEVEADKGGKCLPPDYFSRGWERSKMAKRMRMRGAEDEVVSLESRRLLVETLSAAAAYLQHDASLAMRCYAALLCVAVYTAQNVRPKVKIPVCISTADQLLADVEKEVEVEVEKTGEGEKEGEGEEHARSSTSSSSHPSSPPPSPPALPSPVSAKAKARSMLASSLASSLTTLLAAGAFVIVALPRRDDDPLPSLTGVKWGGEEGEEEERKRRWRRGHGGEEGRGKRRGGGVFKYVCH
mmetsp:Transcript_4081/g.7958  ORF Transcript_4081/g.7958 Transcript_4081/m.7958 type:complete len:283 (-) Transcript_4081:1235-2083(-)